ncbi:hypothetical protein DFP72DRAFT_1010447 [Ephemerocybe angulata]|uniref:Uncharacterized protein n=1 Tax=Ephemerocybe angulata TaxID=980116 RepID=A0A8H6M718_9AGAR|nr:hypothetical protein DFP72DRAFT_1010447 [Tulosesus angulatus]
MPGSMPRPSRKKKQAAAKESLSRQSHQRTVHPRSAPAAVPAPASEPEQPATSLCSTLEEDQITRCTRNATFGQPEQPDRCWEHFNEHYLHYTKYKDAQKKAARLIGGREMLTDGEIAKCMSREEVIRNMAWVSKYVKAIGIEKTEREIHSKRFFLEVERGGGHKHRIKVLYKKIEIAQQVLTKLTERKLCIEEDLDAERRASLLQSQWKKDGRAPSQSSHAQGDMASVSRGAFPWADGTARNVNIPEGKVAENPIRVEENLQAERRPSLPQSRSTNNGQTLSQSAQGQGATTASAGRGTSTYYTNDTTGNVGISGGKLEHSTRLANHSDVESLPRLNVIEPSWVEVLMAQPERHLAEKKMILEKMIQESKESFDLATEVERDAVATAVGQGRSTSANDTTGNVGIPEGKVTEVPRRFADQSDVESRPHLRVIRPAGVEVTRAQRHLAEKKKMLEKVMRSKEYLERETQLVEEHAVAKASKAARDILYLAIERVGRGRLGVSNASTPMPIYPGVLGIWGYTRQVQRALSESINEAIGIADYKARIATEAGIEELKELENKCLPVGLKRCTVVVVSQPYTGPKGVIGQTDPGTFSHDGNAAGGLYGRGQVPSQPSRSGLRIASVGLGVLTLVRGPILSARAILKNIARVADLLSNDIARKWVASIIGAATLGATAYFILDLPNSIPLMVGRRHIASLPALYVEYRAARVGEEARKLLSHVGHDIRERYMTVANQLLDEVRGIEDAEREARKAQA